MPWDFRTEPEFQEVLDWADAFVREEVEDLDYLVDSPYDHADPVRQALIPPLQDKVRERGLWATHLGPELGGRGYGQVKLGLLNEILGRSACAPIVFGSQAPDSGNSEILARFGSPMLKERYLEPLLENKIGSCFSMTEVQGGADPKVFTTTAVLDGDEWVVNGEKWFSSYACFASFMIVMAVTHPDNPPYKRQSLIVVPRETPGLEIVRNVGMGYETPGTGYEAYIRYKDVRVPRDHVLGEPGEAFAISQTRLGGGRIHHAMRTIGLVRRTLDAMCERAVSRFTQGERLADKQFVQGMIADSWTQLEMFRLLTLRTAWRIDECDDYKAVRGEIAAVKAAMQTVLHDVASRTLQLHGSLGVTHEMPFVETLVESFVMGLADGPTEVHKMTVARELLRSVRPAEGRFPSEHVPARREAALAKHADVLARVRDGG
ncbi:acyl-CoA dehydrogenase [Actinomadura sp. KC345]|uniref:acyl-CoA dehydrogenase family protein n=1 Tax=Actinomadura sp. KC345 TaxID=2530371 RepID=UPI00104D4CC9|nr:acyl-CoA dehydrogenase family protein [Actinomadura sp. KC345]TDC57436.1 acyl-CoA dehydrogenase [Actinomadura sp. KC345]